MEYFDYWTVQDASIFEQIRNGGYVPHIEDSKYLNNYPTDDPEWKREMVRMYHTVFNGVCTANDVCQSDVDGVVFAFAKFDADNSKFTSIETFESFYWFIHKNRSALETCWKILEENPNAVVMHLRYPESVKPVAIDFNGWNFCMPPFFDAPGELELKKKLLNGLSRGENQYSGLLGLVQNDVIQCHLPFMKMANVVGCYPMFQMGDTDNISQLLLEYFTLVQSSIRAGGVDESCFSESTIKDSKQLIQEDGTINIVIDPHRYYVDWLNACEHITNAIKEERKSGENA